MVRFIIGMVFFVLHWNGFFQRLMRSFAGGIGAGVLASQLAHFVLKAAPDLPVIVIATAAGAWFGYSFRPRAKPGSDYRIDSGNKPVPVPGSPGMEEERGGAVVFN